MSGSPSRRASEELGFERWRFWAMLAVFLLIYVPAMLFFFGLM